MMSMVGVIFLNGYLVHQEKKPRYARTFPTFPTDPDAADIAYSI